MAGKTDRTGVQYAFKKLSGRANTSNIKSDAQEVIGSNIQVGTQTIFGQNVPTSGSRIDYQIYGSTAEYVVFTVAVITGTTYDADSATGGGGDGSQSAGPHGYKLFLTGNYEALSSNPKKGSSPFTDGSLVHESLGRLQLIPPNFSQESPNPYILKIYEADSGNANEIGDEIPLLDEVDWTFDYYNGILFLQDYDSGKIPAYARGFIYVGDYLSASIGGGSGGGGDGAASYVVMSATGSLSAERVLTPGSGINVTDAGAGSTVTLSVHDSVVATISGSTFTGATKFNSGLSGSLTRLTGGTSYLAAGSNVTITSASNGQITISSTGGGGGGDSGPTFFSSTTNRSIFTTGSTSFVGGQSSPAAPDAASDIGTDVFFFVSGTTGSRTTTNTGSAVFGGDVVVSGSLHVPKLGVTGSVTGATTALEVDRDYAGTTSNSSLTSHAAASGILIDYDVTGDVAASQYQKHKALWIKYDQSAPTFNSAAIVQGTGIWVEMTGSTDGIQSVDGISVYVEDPGSLSGDAARGILINAPAGLVDGTVNGSHLRCVTQGATSDYFDISVGASGLTQLSTIDSSGANAHLNLKPDGIVTILSGGGTTSPSESSYGDTNFFVSGTISSRGTSVKGTSVFGGDVHISGSITSEGTSFVDASGTPVNNQLAIWTDANTIEGDSDLTWDGTTFYASSAGTTVNIQGDSNLNGTVVINQSGADKDFRVETANKSSALQVDGGTDQVLLFSGSLSDAAGYGSSASDPDPREFTDTNFFVSGSIDSRGSAVKGTSVFGGDAVVSGSLHSILGLSGSLTRLTDGSSYLAAGSNITILSASNGQITISSTGGGGGGSGDSAAHYVVTEATGSLSNYKLIEAGTGITLTTGSNSLTVASDLSLIQGRNKKRYIVTASHLADSPFSTPQSNFSQVVYDPDLIDVYLNGMLTLSGTSAQVDSAAVDYTVFSSGSLSFAFDLNTYDVVDVVLSQLNSDSTSGADASATYLVLSATGSLSNERVFTAGTGLSTTDGGAGNTYTVAADDSVVATLSGSVFTGGVTVQGALTSSLGVGTLATKSSTIHISASNAPSSGSVLVAKSSTEAAWQQAIVFGEQPSGTKNGSNLAFALGNAVINNTDLMLFVNGLLQLSGSSNDYTLTGSEINFNSGLAPFSDDVITAIYRPSN